MSAAAAIQPLDLDGVRRVVVLTGAGVSAGSGLPTYRGAGGLWTQPGLAELNTAEAMTRDPAAVWALFGGMRTAAAAAEPNAAHRAIAALDDRIAGEVYVVTQNIDGLHQRAGSKHVIELHGTAFRSRCAAGCGAPAFADVAAHAGEVPTCAQCGGIVRPDVVLFGEPLPVDAEHQTKRAFRGCQLFIAVGTSGTVAPASRMVGWAEFEQARTVLVNAEAPERVDPRFQRVVVGKAEEVLAGLFRGRDAAEV